MSILDLLLSGIVIFIAGALVMRPGRDGQPVIRASLPSVPTSPASRPEKPKATALDKHEVYLAAVEAVKLHLEPPSWAVFPESGEITRNSAGNYSVRSYFTAENTYGKSVRTDWSVVLQDNGDGRFVLLEMDSHR